jgi:hypothetical protein
MKVIVQAFLILILCLCGLTIWADDPENANPEVSNPDMDMSEINYPEVKHQQSDMKEISHPEVE